MEFVLFWLVLVPLAVVAGVIYLGVRLIGSILPGRKEEAVDEARMVQEMYSKLGRLEERVDNLETILMESDRKGEDNG